MNLFPSPSQVLLPFEDNRPSQLPKITINRYNFYFLTVYRCKNKEERKKGRRRRKEDIALINSF
jgi:hypothetical protein